MEVRRPYHDVFTESTDFVHDKAPEIVRYLAREWDVKSGDMQVKVLTPLSAGWDEVWEEALGNVQVPGIIVRPEVQTFDNNLNQIERYGKEGKRVAFMELGTEDGNSKLAELLEDEVDVLFLSNIGDWIGNSKVEGLLDVIEEGLPPVVIFSAKERENELAQMEEGLEEMGYEVKVSQTSDPKAKEVPYQAIAYLTEEESF